MSGLVMLGERTLTKGDLNMLFKKKPKPDKVDQQDDQAKVVFDLIEGDQLPFKVTISCDLLSCLNLFDNLDHYDNVSYEIADQRFTNDGIVFTLLVTKDKQPDETLTNVEVEVSQRTDKLEKRLTVLEDKLSCLSDSINEFSKETLAIKTDLDLFDKFIDTPQEELLEYVKLLKDSLGIEITGFEYKVFECK